MNSILDSLIMIIVDGLLIAPMVPLAILVNKAIERRDRAKRRERIKLETELRIERDRVDDIRREYWRVKLRESLHEAQERERSLTHERDFYKCIAEKAIKKECTHTTA